MVLIEGFQNIPNELVVRMILHPFYKTGFNKTAVQFPKQKFLSNAFYKNSLEKGKVLSFLLNIPLDMPF